METITIPKQEYNELLEEVGILRNKDMMGAIKESIDAKKKKQKEEENVSAIFHQFGFAVL